MTKPIYVSENTWNLLKPKERYFLSMISERRFTKEKIMKNLFIQSREGYYLMQRRVAKKIEKDVKLFNELKK